jgi:hypothetical protein
LWPPEDEDRFPNLNLLTFLKISFIKNSKSKSVEVLESIYAHLRLPVDKKGSKEWLFYFNYIKFMQIGLKERNIYVQNVIMQKKCFSKSTNKLNNHLCSL